MGRATAAAAKLTAIGGDIGNSAARGIATLEPYAVKVAVEGVADLILHRWNCEKISTTCGGPGKGTRARKTDDVESYTYRDDDGYLCVPGRYIVRAIQEAGRYRQDPRSPRKSMLDLLKAGVSELTILGRINGGVKEWGYEHMCRCVVQRNAINRVRPAFKKGWTCEWDLQVGLPEYVDPALLNELLALAGRVIGLADFRPTYGRFVVTGFAKL